MLESNARLPTLLNSLNADLTFFIRRNFELLEFRKGCLKKPEIAGTAPPLSRQHIDIAENLTCPARLEPLLNQRSFRMGIYLVDEEADGV